MDDRPRLLCTGTEDICDLGLAPSWSQGYTLCCRQAAKAPNNTNVVGPRDGGRQSHRSLCLPNCNEKAQKFIILSELIKLRDPSLQFMIFWVSFKTKKW